MTEPWAYRSIFAKELAGWFRQHARKLTWRQTRDPYAIWVSEVMLQQTRVETVERFYSAFMKRFPSFEQLAAASSDEVLEMWSGLGYYRRARLLHRGAQFLVEQGAKSLPSEVPELRRIPGIGPYTAGAIASIAFDQPAALVDGNVARVSSRVRAVIEPKEQGADAKAHWAWVESVLHQGRPRELAQAVMELGAMVCTPKNPACDVCPVARGCAALEQGRQLQIPAPKQKAKVKPQEMVALALMDRSGGLLFEKRPQDLLLAGLWSLPMIEQGHSSAAELVPGAWIEAYQRYLPASLRDPKRWSPLEFPAQDKIVHIFTHRRWHLKVMLGRFEGHWSRSLRSSQTLRGVRADLEADRLGATLEGGVPTVTRKLIGAFAKLQPQFPS